MEIDKEIAVAPSFDSPRFCPSAENFVVTGNEIDMFVSKNCDSNGYSVTGTDPNQNQSNPTSDIPQLEDNIPSSPLNRSAIDADLMASPNDSENSFYTARDSEPMNMSLTASPQSPKYNSNMNRTFPNDSDEAEAEMDLFTFAVPMIPQTNHKVPSKSSDTSVDNVGLNIFASPPGRGGGHDDDEFISAAAFADTANANDWDRLLMGSTGSAGNVPSVANRWDRDSLYQRFDPLVAKKASSPPLSTCQTQRLTLFVESAEQKLLRKSVGRIEQNSSEVDLFGINNSVDEKDVVVVADENDIEDTTLVSSSDDFAIRRRSSAASGSELLNSSSSRRASKSGAFASPRLSLVEGSLLPLCPVETDDTDSRMEQALAQQELNFRAELSEKDERIQELEKRLEQFSESAKHSEIKTKTSKTELSQALAQVDKLKTALNAAVEEKLSVTSEFEQLRQDLNDAQNAVADINSKYEQVKTLLENSRQNEELLIQRDAAMVATVAECDAQLEEIKEVVKNKLDNMFQNYETKFKAMDTDSGRIRVLLRRAEMKIEGLENEVAQKMAEIKKLSVLCDDLISQGMKENRY